MSLYYYIAIFFTVIHLYIVILLFYCIIIVFISLWYYELYCYCSCFLHNFVYTSMMIWICNSPPRTQNHHIHPRGLSLSNRLQEQRPPKGRNCRRIRRSDGSNTWNLKKALYLNTFIYTFSFLNGVYGRMDEFSEVPNFLKEVTHIQ